MGGSGLHFQAVAVSHFLTATCPMRAGLCGHDAGTPNLREHGEQDPPAMDQSRIHGGDVHLGGGNLREPPLPRQRLDSNSPFTSVSLSHRTNVRATFDFYNTLVTIDAFTPGKPGRFPVVLALHGSAGMSSEGHLQVASSQFSVLSSQFLVL